MGQFSAEISPFPGQFSVEINTLSEFCVASLARKSLPFQNANS
jgi:hypothetical protein